MEDPLALLILALWPLGFMFGVCSPCCRKCPQVLNVNKCRYCETVGTAPKSGSTSPESSQVARFAQSKIDIPLRITITAAGASRTPVGTTRTQRWRLNRAAANPNLEYDFVGPAWHLEIDVSVTGVATQEEAGFTTNVGLDSAGQAKLFVSVNQWTATITIDQAMSLSPVGLQRFDSFGGAALTNQALAATQIAGSVFDGWAVAKQAGITITERALIMQIEASVFLVEATVIAYLSGDATLNIILGQTFGGVAIRGLCNLIEPNSLCGVSADNISVGVAMGIYPSRMTLKPAVPVCGDADIAILPRGTCGGPLGGYTTEYTRGSFFATNILTVNNVPLVVTPALLFCGNSILWNIINGPCRDELPVRVGSGQQAVVTLDDDAPETLFDRPAGCPGGFTRRGDHCFEPLTVTHQLANGTTQVFTGSATFRNNPAPQSGFFVLYGGNLSDETSGVIGRATGDFDSCSGSGTLTVPSYSFCPAFQPCQEEIGVNAQLQYFPAGISGFGDEVEFEPRGDCELHSVSPSSPTMAYNSIVTGDCFDYAPTWRTPDQCIGAFHLQTAGCCTPEVTVDFGEDLATVERVASGDKEGLIEVVAIASFPQGPGVRFTVECGEATFTRTVRRRHTPPSPPLNLTATRGPCSEVLLQWSPPASGGGLPLTVYTIQFRRFGVTPWTVFGTVAASGSSATVTGLLRLGFQFRVAATNALPAGESLFSGDAAGIGQFSDIVSVDTNPATLGPPTSLTVALGPCDTANLSWSPPFQSQCHVVANYLLQFRIAGSGGAYTTFGSVAGTATTGTITGLAACTRHEFRVVRVDDLATQASSNVVAVPTSVTAGTPTGVTAGLGATPGDVNVAWSAVEFPCFENTGYLVQFRLTSTFLWTDGPTVADKFALVTGLEAGGIYRFRVRAINCSGNGSFSAQSLSITIPE